MTETEARIAWEQAPKGPQREEARRVYNSIKSGEYQPVETVIDGMEVFRSANGVNHPFASNAERSVSCDLATTALPPIDFNLFKAEEIDGVLHLGGVKWQSEHAGLIVEHLKRMQDNKTTFDRIMTKVKNLGVDDESLAAPEESPSDDPFWSLVNELSAE